MKKSIRFLGVAFQVIVDYITNVLKGSLSEKYSSTEGRIQVL